MNFSSLNPVDEHLFFTRNDPQDPRLGDLATSCTSVESLKPVSIMGYPDDEGISLNGGRPGAKEGPTSIRKALYKMTPSTSRGVEISDLGDVKLNSDLNSRHQQASELALGVLKHNSRLVTLGGGHDYGFPDLDAFCRDSLERKKKPFIINFDAHLDARPNHRSNNSGTSFYRLLEKYGKQVDFFEVGIQDWCNSLNHREWVKKQGGRIFSLKDFLESRLRFLDFMKKHVLARITKKHALAASVDIDFFSSSIAPGASQAFPVGVPASEFLVFWSYFLKRQPRFLGIYEVSPPLDLDSMTSKWAAILIHQFIFT